MKRLFALAMLACVACGAPASPPDEDAAPQRVAIYAPSAAEVLIRLGLTDRIVGVGGYGDWPEPLADRRRIGSFDQPDIEALLELDTDLVLTTVSVNAAEAYSRIERVGIAVEPLSTSTFDGVLQTIRQLGERFDRSEAADQMITEIETGLQRVRERAASMPVRRVLFAVGSDPLYVAGPGSHLDELIRLVGAENVAADADAPYQRFSIEAILERAPEVIIDTSDQADRWQRWPTVPAVQQGHVHAVDGSLLVVPGARLVEMAETMFELVHGEAIGS